MSRKQIPALNETQDIENDDLFLKRSDTNGTDESVTWETVKEKFLEDVPLGLDNLSDVELDDPQENQALIYDGEKWVNEEQTATGGDTGGINFFDPESADFFGGTIGSWSTDNGSDGASSILSIPAVVEQGYTGGNTIRLLKGSGDAENHFFKCPLSFFDVGIPKAYRGKQVFGSFKYDLSEETNYESGDYEVQVWDVTSTPVQLYTGPEPLNILKSQGRFDFTVSFESTTEEAEIRIVCKTDKTDEFEVNEFGLFRLGPAAQVSTAFRRQVEIDLAGSGDFTAGSVINISRNGGNVTYSMLASHSSLTLANSADGVVPEWARPILAHQHPFISIGADERRIEITSSGQIILTYASARTSSGIASSGYPVEDNQSQVMSTNELGLQRIKVSAAGNAGQALTANVTDIPFIATSNPFSAWDGTKFIAPKTASYRMQGFVRITTDTDVWFNAFVDGVSNKVAAATNENIDTHKFMWEGTLLADQEWSLRPDTNCTLLNEPTAHWLEISSQEDLTVLGTVRNNEYLEVSDSSQTSWPFSAATWGILGSLTLSPGEWDLTGVLNTVNSSSLASNNYIELGITTDATATDAGLVTGVNNTQRHLVLNSGFRGGITVPNYRVVVTQQTTFNLKARSIVITNFRRRGWRLSARRIS